MRSLKTDYTDCYDAWFELAQPGIPVFHRMAQHSWSIERAEMFRTFEHLGLEVPRWGMAGQFDPTTQVVAYTDPLAHCGEGKELGMAGTFPQSMLVSAYEAELPGISYRYFNIAGNSDWFKHFSTEDWRSNCGDGDLEEMVGFESQRREIDKILKYAFWNPVYAIDFVVGPSKEGLILKAIDFNPAPKLSGTPIKESLLLRNGGPKGIVNTITARLDHIASETDYDNNQIHLK